MYIYSNIIIVFGKFSQFLNNLIVYHVEALKKLLYYIIELLNRCIRYGGSRHNIIIYSNADWANNKLDRKNVSGRIIIFNRRPISWYNKKQKTVLILNIEAEYIVLVLIAKQI
jgi:hypothetical protein